MSINTGTPPTTHAKHVRAKNTPTAKTAKLAPPLVWISRVTREITGTATTTNAKHVKMTRPRMKREKSARIAVLVSTFAKMMTSTLMPPPKTVQNARATTNQQTHRSSVHKQICAREMSAKPILSCPRMVQAREINALYARVHQHPLPEK